MALVVALSNYLVQFPINYLGLQNLLTYGAFKLSSSIFDNRFIK